jgi:hypothetical protein
VVVAELVVLLLPTAGVEMAVLPHLVEEDRKLDSQRLRRRLDRLAP